MAMRIENLVRQKRFELALKKFIINVLSHQSLAIDSVLHIENTLQCARIDSRSTSEFSIHPIFGRYLLVQLDT
jgi:hypothetical protein